MRPDKVIMVLLLLCLISCEKKKEDIRFDELPCNYVDFKYYFGNQDPLGAMSGNYILIGSDTINSDNAIQDLIRSKKYIDKNYDYTIHRSFNYGYKYACIKLSKTCNCNEIAWLLNDLKQEPIISYAHYTIQTNNCANLIFEKIGELCVNSYCNIFYVRVKDANDITDLNSTILETNTKIIGQYQFMPNWYSLSTDKNSKGDALEMSNYFYETGLFDASEPVIINLVVE